VYVRCRLGLHRWTFGVMPGQYNVISKACRRCYLVRLQPAESIPSQLQRADDWRAIGHLFDTRGRPK
jgi:hypothetical protein